jgi:hypothetical protein
MQRISDAKDRLKAVHDQTKAYEEQVQWGQVKDTGMELYQFAMGGLGLVGQFNKDVKAFHEMMGATERMVRDANELRKVPFWKFWESGPKTKDLLYSGLNFKRTWERFRTTGGGKIVDKVITFAKKFIKVSGSSYNPVSTTPTGATPPLVQNTVQVVTDILRGSSSNNDTSSVSSDQAKTYKAMRESAYRRLTEAMQNGDSPELLKMHKEEFDIIDARYREAIGR